MKGTCQYCNSLSKAIKNQNYCSNQGDAIHKVSSNAFYFKSNNLQSGEHVSRISIRTLSDGYQRHKVNSKDYILDKHHYLMINEGEEFKSEIKTNSPVEGLLLAFNMDDYNAMHNYWSQSDTRLLDDPYFFKTQYENFSTRSVKISPRMMHLLSQLKRSMVQKDNHKLYYEELFNNVLTQIYSDQMDCQKAILKIKAKKTSTKIEIYRRLNIVKNYIDNHLHENVTLNQLSEVATLSSYHLQRSFKELYSLSPHNYLIKKRLEKAQFLIKDSNKSIRSICSETGFQNQSSFGRLFKKKFGLTPLNYRHKKSL